MVRVAELNRDEWAQLERDAVQSTLFHTDEWLAILERTYHAKILRLGFFEGKQLIGGMPVLVMRKFIYKIAGSPLDGTVTPYQGPICLDPLNSGKLFKAFWGYAESCKWDFVQMTPFPAAEIEARQLNSPYSRCEARQTICVNIRPGEPEILRAMKQQCRNKIRQAVERGAVIEEVDASECHWIETYFEMSVETYRRQWRPPAIPKSFFENVGALLGASGKMRVLFAKYDSKVVAAAIFLVHRNVLYAWDAVSSRAYSHLRASSLIYWTIIRSAHETGLQTFDMLGANIPTVARFKEGFGGSFIAYETFLRSKGWLARAGESGYRFCAPAMRWLLARSQ
jgi:hypothetical protein